MSEDRDELERMRRALEASGRYRVLKHYEKPARYQPAPAEDVEVRTGLYVDVETTGLSSSQDRIIELGLVAFEFDREGRIYRLLHELSAFEDPGMPLPPRLSASPASPTPWWPASAFPRARSPTGWNGPIW